MDRKLPWPLISTVVLKQRLPNVTGSPYKQYKSVVITETVTRSYYKTVIGSLIWPI